MRFRGPQQAAPAILVRVDGLGPHEPLLMGDTKIGRHSDNNIVIDDLSVSAYHAVIRYQNGSFVLYPQAVKVPMKVNGFVIQAAVQLENGDIITFGVTQFRFVR